jgi:hypothetical protein
MLVNKQTIVGLSVGVALLGSGLIATLIYYLLKKVPSPPACPPCNCYAQSVDNWKPSS